LFVRNGQETQTREVQMSILTQEQLLLNAQTQFDTLKKSILDHTDQRTRIDQVERSLFSELLAIGLTLLRAFVAGVGMGNEGKHVSPGDHTLHRSDQPHERPYRSVFGTLSIRRWVYARGAKKKIEHAPTDARLGLPRGEYSYVMEDWAQRLCLKETFAGGVDGLAAILGFAPSVQTAEEMNLRMAEHAESFRIQQPAPAATAQETILVATADGTSVPMHRADRTRHPAPQAESRKGSTRRAYVGAVYSIEPFVREPQDVLDELLREQSAARRPRPQGKRLWAEMAAAREGSMTSGSSFVFIEMAIDVSTRDPNRQHTLVCLLDGEQKLWDLQREWLGRSVEILDFFHVLKRVGAVSKVVHPKQQSVRDEWVSAQMGDLLTGKVETVIRRWRRLLCEAEGRKCWSKDDRETVSSAIGYFCNNRHRMCYDEYLSKGYPIGSGIAEGACRNLVKDRLDCTGMHWRLPGARAMLKTRALYLNGEWDDFVEYRIQREQETLYNSAA
jgi:hypothetical protein